MAHVTRCDACDAVIPHEYSKKVRLYKVNELGNTANVLLDKDICPSCYNKVLEVLGNVKQTNNE